MYQIWYLVRITAAVVALQHVQTQSVRTSSTSVVRLIQHFCITPGTCEYTRTRTGHHMAVYTPTERDVPRGRLRQASRLLTYRARCWGRAHKARVAVSRRSPTKPGEPQVGPISRVQDLHHGTYGVRYACRTCRQIQPCAWTQTKPTPGLTRTRTRTLTLRGARGRQGQSRGSAACFGGVFPKKRRAAERPALTNKTRILHSFCAGCSCTCCRSSLTVYVKRCDTTSRSTPEGKS